MKKEQNFYKKSIDKPVDRCYNKVKIKEKKREVNEMLDGMFLGMQFEEVLAQLQSMGVEPDEVDYPSEDEVGSVVVGDVYGVHYAVEFDVDGHCDYCGWQEEE